MLANILIAPMIFWKKVGIIAVHRWNKMVRIPIEYNINRTGNNG